MGCEIFGSTNTSTDWHFPGGTEGKLENLSKENISHHGFELSTSQYKFMAAPECLVTRAFINWSQLLTASKVNHNQIKVLSPAVGTLLVAQLVKALR